MNNCSERLYNGIVKKTYLRPDAWYVSDPGRNHISYQRPLYGTFHNRGFTVST